MKIASSLIFGMLFVSTSFAQQLPAKTIVAVDVSGTSTFLADQSSADAAGRYVQGYISELKPKHDLILVSLGDTGMARRSIDIRAAVTEHRGSSANRLAPQFGAFLRSLPQRNLEPDDTTSILEFLGSLESVCLNGGATVILFTDGLEWSSLVDGQTFARGSASLPQPESPLLKGCRVEMLGVGHVRSSLSSAGLEHRLIAVWRAYLEAAGADSIAVRGASFDF